MKKKTGIMLVIAVLFALLVVGGVTGCFPGSPKTVAQATEEAAVTGPQLSDEELKAETTRVFQGAVIKLLKPQTVTEDLITYEEGIVLKPIYGWVLGDGGQTLIEPQEEGKPRPGKLWIFKVSGPQSEAVSVESIALEAVVERAFAWDLGTTDSTATDLILTQEGEIRVHTRVIPFGDSTLVVLLRNTTTFEDDDLDSLLESIAVPEPDSAPAGSETPN